MSLSPSLFDSYYVDNDKHVLKMMDDMYSKNITINQANWAEADIDTRFRAGDQTLWGDIYGNLVAPTRRNFTFNRISRCVNMVSGYQRQNRKSTAVVPVEGSDDKTSDQFSKLLYHVDKTANVLDNISEGFEGAVTTGMNMLATWLDFRNDPVNGEIKVDNLHFSSFLIDSYFQKMDLTDCSSIWTRKYVTREEANSLLPGREKDIKSIRGWGAKDGKFQYMFESYSDQMQGLVAYDEFWYMTSRKQKMLVDTITGECKEWQGHDENLKDFLRNFPQVIEINQEVPTVKLAIVLQGRVMYDGPNPLGVDRYPFTPIWCYYYPQLTNYSLRTQGIVRGLRDAQYLYNRRRVIELDILESQISSGYIYKEDALVNPKDVFLQGQGKGLALKAEAQMTDVMPIQAPQIPPSMIQLSELLANEIPQISGINEELLGSAEDDKAGILSMLRQGAGLTTLQTIFDHLDRSQKMLGELHMSIIQANWTPGKVQRILNEEPTEQFYNRAFGKYDCVIDETPVTSTQRQIALKKALYFREIGIPITTEYLIEQANFPDKEKLIESVVKQEQQQAEQQQKMEALQMQQLQVENETKLAYAEAQHSLAAERMNKVQLDAALSAERLQRADEDRTGAVLNLIKAIKEIEGMDFDKLERSLRLVHEIEASQAENKQETVA